ncbi:integral membrane protein [Colletotrichum zoysiae]|uniref:Integral membrane protein n=1 Tax=Colletotrichum zoysiae TaxID=1216348 RepID=A0AAD9HD01_9PEZI|nr:integral membrane protein [Colletotrichum zoysiae]
MDLLVSRNQEGERMSDVARGIPQIPVGGFSRAIQVTACVMLGLSTLVIALRVYVRLQLSESRKVWGWDDAFAVLGWIPFLPSVAFLIIGTYWGLGAHDSQIPEGQLVYYQIKVKEEMFWSEVLYFASTVLTKLSMAIMIVRLSTTRVYAYIIWGNMAVVAVNMTVCMVILLASCSPIPALWNEKLGYCRIPNGWMIVSYAGTVVLAMVDWTCAITPFFLIQSLQMPKRRKVSLQVILGLGIFGSAAGLVRMGYYHSYDTKRYPHESLYNWGQTVLWSVLEGGLGIITCSLPPLRKLVSTYYHGSSNEDSIKSKGNTAVDNTELRAIRLCNGGKWNQLPSC